MTDRDRGMTLPELLISITVVGLIIAVLSAAVSVTLRTQTDTQSRFDIARWEQNLGAWLPNDLASAVPESFNAAPGVSACGTATCTAGANVLQLYWDDAGVRTTVGYRYQPAATGDRFELHRVECVGATPCTSSRVLSDLDPPPSPWTPKVVPANVLDVDVPGDSDGDPDNSDRPERRVIVRVNGVPTSSGVVRSSQVNLGAGGAPLGELPIPRYTAPSFAPARSDCGGPVTLLVDRSISISEADFVRVKQGVKSFVAAFAGTDTKLQIIPFAGTADILGPTGRGANGAWNYVFDLSDESVVERLTDIDSETGLDLPNNVSPIDTLGRDGGTNWEDALYRAFYLPSGQPYTKGDPTAPMPELVVMFTDGLPNNDRLQESSGGSVASVAVPGQFDYTLLTDRTSATLPREIVQFSARGWYRSKELLASAAVRDSGAQVIGVGVGQAFTTTRNVLRFQGRAFNSPLVAVQSWPSGAVNDPIRPIRNSEFLGDVLVGGDPRVPGEQNGFRSLSYSGNPDDPWGDLTGIDMLESPDFTQFASGLAAIALQDCGGTLSVKTVDEADQPSIVTAVYEVRAGEADPVTLQTNRIRKSDVATIDFPPAVTSQEVVVVPQQLPGVEAVEWSCREKNAALPAGRLRLNDPIAGPMGGITVTLRTDSAVVCTVEVAPA